MNHYIYKHTNKINGKSYIGQTKNPKMRWRVEGYKYCRKFYKAILKYGWDNFTHEILKECKESDVDYWESYYIKLYDTINKGYNLESGGCANKTVSEETKALISEAGKRRKGYRKGIPAWNKGIKMSEEYRKKLSEAHKGKQTGRITSEETKRKISEAQIGKIVSDETRKRLSEAHKGKPSNNKGKTFSEEWRKKLSLAHIGKTPANKGKPLSEETKQKLSKALKGRKPTNQKKVINIDTNEVFISAKEAERQCNINAKNISAVCTGKRPKAGGYRWKYV